MRENEVFDKISDALQQDEVVKRYARKGFCRLWSFWALRRLDRLTREKELKISYEAREIDLGSVLSHTFVQVTLTPDNMIYYFDGTGPGSNPPFFGPQDEAPVYLLKNRPDRMNLYRTRTNT